MLLLLRLKLKGEMGLGLEGCRPQEQDEAPRGSAAAMTRVADGSQRSVTMREGRRLNCVIVLREAQRAIYTRGDPKP